MISKPILDKNLKDLNLVFRLLDFIFFTRNRLIWGSKIYCTKFRFWLSGMLYWHVVARIDPIRFMHYKTHLLPDGTLDDAIPTHAKLVWLESELRKVGV